MSTASACHATLQSLAREVAYNLGLRTDGVKAPCSCVFREHRSNKPAVLFLDSGQYHCSACAQTWTIVEVAKQIGISVPPRLRDARRSERTEASRQAASPTTTSTPHAERAQDAVPVGDVWRFVNYVATRAESPAAIACCGPVVDYLKSRGLAAAFGEPELIGVVPGDYLVLDAYGMFDRLCPFLIWHRLCAALYDQSGTISSIQARSLWRHSRRKTLNLEGIPSSGTMFANYAGRLLLRADEGNTERTAILGEGLSDFLALSLSAPCPVFCAPGAGLATSSVGRWARGRNVLLALDVDTAGDREAKKAARAVQRHGGAPHRVQWPRGACDACETLDLFRAREEEHAVEGLSRLLDRYVALPGGRT